MIIALSAEEQINICLKVAIALKTRFQNPGFFIVIVNILQYNAY